MQIVVERLALAQELGAEDDAIAGEPFASLGNVADRHSRFDNDDRLVIGGKHLLDDGIHRRCVKEIALDIVIGRHGSDGEIGPVDRRRHVGREAEVEIVAQEVLLD